MRIISEHHDYYDCIMRQAMDRSITYVRKREEIHFEKLDQDSWKNIENWHQFDESWSFKNVYYHLNLIIIGFCGEVIPGVIIGEQWWGQGIQFKKDHFVYPNSKPSISLDVINELDKEQVFPENKISEATRKWLETGETKKWYAGDNWSVDKLKGWFLKYKVPVFAINGSYLILNPRLHDFHFFRVVDSQQAFQKIQQFLTNELVEQKDGMAQPVPEKVKIASHGFDTKWSFRKESEKK